LKATGVVRRIDDLGRVVIPKEIRKTLRIKEGDPLEIFTDKEGEVILKKYSPIGELTEFATGYAETLAKTTGHIACITDKDTVIAVSGGSKKDFLEQLENNNHILLSEYINTDTKVLIDFNCEHEPHLITPEKYKRGDRCPNCVGKNGQAKKDFMSLLDKNKHYLIGEYINNSTKVLIDFNCGHEPHLTSPSKYKAGQRCPKCANENRNNLSIEKARIDFLQVIKSNNHILKSEYINSSTKVLIDFKCGHNPHWITPNDYKLYKGCPYCKNKGEGALYNLLLETFEEVETQKTFDNLKDKKLLSYDFYLPTYNLLIELDGVHHREIVTYGKDYESSKDRFEDRIKKDKLKNEYAKNNNIHLLRIEYNSKIELDKWKQLILDKINEIETNSVA